MQEEGHEMSESMSYLTQTPKPRWWALDPTCTDERAIELYTSRYKKPPAEIKRYPRSILLVGPIVNNGK